MSIPQHIFQWLFLTVLLLPWWWLSVVVSYFLRNNTEVGSFFHATPTKVLLVLLAGFYLIYLAIGFTRGYSNNRFKGQLDSDNVPAQEKKRVAVIGAGMAGMVATKELQEEGHIVEVYEKTEGWGGVWADSKSRGGRAWGTTLTSTGSLNTTFSDSPEQIYHPENGTTPYHYTRNQFYSMMSNYEKRHKVFSDNLNLNTEVTQMTELPGQRWRLTLETSKGVVTNEEFDAVTICSGLNQEPTLPDINGVGDFTGEEIHVNDYDPSNPAKYAGKNVLMLGAGETAADLAKELVDNGVGHLYVAPRNPTLTLARNFTSAPPDYPESRIVYGGPMFNRWALLMTSVPQMLTNVVTPYRVKTFGFKNWYRMARVHDTIKAFPSIVASVNTTKSDALWYALSTKKGTVVSPVEEIQANGAKLSDGTDLPVDAIIYCTGYTNKHSFLPLMTARPSSKNLSSEGKSSASNSKILSSKELYKLTVHPDYDNIAVIGYARGLVGAITLSSEMQARWWALIVSGKRTLPSAKAKKRHIKYLARKSRKFGQSTRTTMTFANSLARHDVGCEPDMFKLFRTDRRLWWQVLNGVICNAQFRIDGVHAKPQTARTQLQMPGSLHDADNVDSIDMFYNTVPLSLVSIPLWRVFARLLPGFQTRSALGSYV